MADAEKGLSWPTILAADEFWAYFYLTTWFLLNIVITLYSKAVFSLYAFPCPLLLTTVHMICTAIGVFLCQAWNIFQPAQPTWTIAKTMLWFSVIFTVNIWLSNASLLAVSVNLHQVVRTTIPLFTMATSAILFKEHYSPTLLPSVIVVIVGVALTVWGDMAFTAFGMSIVILGCFFSSLKGIITQKTQVGSTGLSSLDVLRWLCPLAVIQLLFFAWVFGEYDILYKRWDTLNPALAVHLPLLGLVAFGLNFVSFRCAALLNPLTLNVAGNAKQVVTCLLSIAVFGGTLSISLAVGIFTTAIGAYWYTRSMSAWRAKLLERMSDKTIAVV